MRAGYLYTIAYLLYVGYKKKNSTKLQELPARAVRSICNKNQGDPNRLNMNMGILCIGNLDLYSISQHDRCSFSVAGWTRFIHAVRLISTFRVGRSFRQSRSLFCSRSIRR